MVTIALKRIPFVALLSASRAWAIHPENDKWDVLPARGLLVVCETWRALVRKKAFSEPAAAA